MTPTDATTFANPAACGAFRPLAPRRSADTGLSRSFLTHLILKTFYYRNDMLGHEVARSLHLPFSVIDEHLEDLRREKLVEVKGAEGNSTASYRFAITQHGRDRAREALKISQYVGPAPVTLKDYTDGLLAQTSSREPVNGTMLQAGLSHLVLPDEVISQVGPALNAQRSLFLYGSPGNGKTVLAEAIGRALGGDLLIPYAVEVDSHVIKLMDPIFHGEPETLDGGHGAFPPGAETLASFPSERPDGRWVMVRRPVVFAGGELTLEMLDLAFNPISKFHEAPIQMKANGGVFLVDDFGRQRMRPQDLLNRWIVPLESRVDYLTLHTGRKFQVPFEVLPVFATNLDPASLADEAFLRRIPYKIPIEDPTVEQFTRIFELNCQRRNLRFHQVMVAYLLRRHYAPENRPLRACHARDLLDQVTALSHYRGHEPVLTREMLDSACRSYFVDQEGPLVQTQSGHHPVSRLEIH
jgi:hypothetical protein